MVNQLHVPTVRECLVVRNWIWSVLASGLLSCLSKQSFVLLAVPENAEPWPASLGDKPSISWQYFMVPQHWSRGDGICTVPPSFRPLGPLQVGCPFLAPEADLDSVPSRVLAPFLHGEDALGHAGATVLLTDTRGCAGHPLPDRIIVWAQAQVLRLRLSRLPHLAEVKVVIIREGTRI
ncbi:hypothetical protein CDD83_10461 [Cordyceps sp. RAO-2017]|nr:hypothetical protein CDD83_10461 [Cordyceps sp. RAO-2017]